MNFDRFALPFEPDLPTFTTCAFCEDDILSGHEAYVLADSTGEQLGHACSRWCFIEWMHKTDEVGVSGRLTVVGEGGDDI